MKKTKNSKKSTTKNRGRGINPIIPIIAVVEVIALIAASTYAWYYLSVTKQITTDVITVSPDSGLDIDFKNANTNDSINIWEYIDDSFKFEPATSLDGRNIYFPTSGTFDATDATKMTFRDGTINDINSKYLNIDFELTNTNPDTEMEVYLNNSSYFYVDNSSDHDITQQSRALRLAFYPNNGASGNVGSEMIYNDSNSSAEDSSSVISGSESASSKLFTIYFDNSVANWSNVYAYIYDSNADMELYPSGTGKNYWAADPLEYTSWEDKNHNKMERVAGSTYSITLTNPIVDKAKTLSGEYVYQQDENGNPVYETNEDGSFVLDENNEKIRKKATFSDGSYEYVASTFDRERKYDTVIFYNGLGKQSVKLSLTDSGKLYTYNSALSNYSYNDELTKEQNNTNEMSTIASNTSVSRFDYTTKTVYFAMPNWWNNCYAYTWYRDGDTDVPYSAWPGDKMKSLGAGIYSYEYNANQSGYILFNDGAASVAGSGVYNQTYNLSLEDGCIYYVNSQSLDSADGNKPKYNCTKFTGKNENGVDTDQYAQMASSTLYFYNNHGWNAPYAKVFVASDNIESQQTFYDIPLISLTGNVYYCTVPQIYERAFFHAKNIESDNDRTKLINSLTDGESDQSDVEIKSGWVYRPLDQKRVGVDNGAGGTYNDKHYAVTGFEYANYIKNDGYAVIAPGVSAGFQRAYSPVVSISNATGTVQRILPAFANSIDNYINNSNNTLFVLPPNSMLSLSMIVWLEGTDEECTTGNYASNLIRLRLEFSTQTVNQGETDVYTYKFYDKTNELWTSNRVKTESGVTVAPVIQLYDKTIKRGYLMDKDDFGTYENATKISVWAVKAPRSIADYGHDIEFRRVNPYNEDEIWNYWDAGPCSTGTHIGTENLTKGAIYAQALSTSATSGTTISFTAFADGSPTREMLINNESQVTNVPERSCGGLWGNHTVHKLYVLDGGATTGKDDYNHLNTRLSDNGGALTIRYTYYYYYKSGASYVAVPVKVEYRGSEYSDSKEGCYHSIFSFNMPQDVYDMYAKYSLNLVSTQCSIQKYQNFNANFAMNSPKNNSLVLFSALVFEPSDLDNDGESDPISGDYLELGYEIDTSKTLNEYTASTKQKNYWGSDILYIQTNYSSDNTFNTASSMYTQFENSNGESNGNHLLRVRFFSDTEVNEMNASRAEIGKEADSGNDFYTVLFQNDNFSGSGQTGFACVIPNDKPYYFYRIENTNNAQNWFRNQTKQIQLEHMSARAQSAYPNSNYAISYYNYVHIGTAADGVTTSSLSVCKMDYYFHTVYFQTKYLAYTDEQPMKCYVWNNKDGGADELFGPYPGVEMTLVGYFEDTEIYQYKIDIKANWYNMLFYSTKFSKQSVNMTVPDESGLIFEYNTEQAGFTPTKMEISSGVYYHACNSTENVYADFWTTNWPHFNSNSIVGSEDLDY